MDDFKTGWDKYYIRNKLTPPRETLVKALDFFKHERLVVKKAVDLGCGHGNDTLFLLQQGWQVLASDRNPDAIQLLKNHPGLANSPALTCTIQELEQTTLPKQTIALVNASFALPFCRPESFNMMWDQITGSLISGGRFCGQFFGPKDGWSHNPNLSFFTQEQIKQMLAGFDIEFWREEEMDKETAQDKMKHWHIFHVVARKK